MQPFAQEVRESHIKRRLLEVHSRSPTCKAATLKKLKRAPATQSISEMSALVSPAELATIQAETAFEVRVLLSEVCYRSDVNYLIRHIDQPLSNAALFADIIIQTIDGLIELYELRVVHRDIHFGNVLLKVKPDTKSVLVLLHDFGTSQMNCAYYPDYMYDLERLMQCVLASGYFKTKMTAARKVIAAVSSMNEVKTAMQAVQNVFSVHYTPHCVDITLF
jgi:serine/threonine protein kinase